MKSTRNTKQKNIVEMQIDSFTTFFTAEELYEKCLEKDGNIGIATIYRFLKDLEKNQKIHSYVCNRKRVYSKESNAHSHFTCQRCGKVLHIDIKNIDPIKNQIQGSISQFQIDVQGICEECLRKK